MSFTIYTLTRWSASISEWEICVPSSSVIKGYSMTIPPIRGNPPKNHSRIYKRRDCRSRQSRLEWSICPKSHGIRYPLIRLTNTFSGGLEDQTPQRKIRTGRHARRIRKSCCARFPYGISRPGAHRCERETLQISEKNAEDGLFQYAELILFSRILRGFCMENSLLYYHFLQ